MGLLTFAGRIVLVVVNIVFIVSILLFNIFVTSHIKTSIPTLSLAQKCSIL